MKRTSLLWLILISFPALTQDFIVKRVDLTQGKVNIYFDLVDTVARVYTINAYSSIDNFIAPLQNISGDAGLEVKPGPDKKIVWDPVAELGAGFDGKVAIEVRGRVYIPFVRFERFEEYKSLKRGKPYQVSWTGGTQQNVLLFELYKGDKKTGVHFTDIANTGKYKMTLPRNVKPGKGYRFKITDTKNKDEVVFTDSFAVKPQVPFVFKVATVMGLGTLAYFIFRDNSPEEIADPIDPN